MSFATLALVSITLFWGMTFPLIRISVQSISPSQFVFCRFAMALLIILPFAIAKLRKSSKDSLSSLFRMGGTLGLISWVCYQAQTLGLQSVESGRAAFLAGTSIILVPFMSPFFGRGLPKAIDYLSALGAMFGLYLFTDPALQGISEGDLLVLLCAVMYAVYIHIIQKWATDKTDATLLCLFQIAGIFVGSGAYSLIRWEPFTPMNGTIIFAILFCAIFATIITTWIQTRYQRETTPERLALIFGLEPVFASIFGYLLLGEVLSLRSIIGCAVILGSIVGSEFFKIRKFKVLETQEDRL